MRLDIVAAAWNRDSSLPAPDRFPPRSLRRASRLTRLALPPVEQVWATANLEASLNVGLIVGTGLADQEQTTDFLQRLYAKGGKLVSPQAFQRSVHGAVCGELAILYGLRGYNMTVTQGRLSGHAALYAAGVALLSGRCQQAVVVAVEGTSEVLSEALAALGEAPDAIADGAAAVVIQVNAPEPLLSIHLDLEDAQTQPHPYLSGAEALVQTAQVAMGGGELPPGLTRV